MKLYNIRHYMFKLLEAVNHLAENGIMHRDIKPSNFLYDPDSQTCLLIDFGLSEVEVDYNGKPKVKGSDETIKKIASL